MMQIEKRKPLIAGNWKMHKTCQEAVETARLLVGATENTDGVVEIVIAPPFTALAPVADVLKGTNIKLSGQDLYWESEGAYTGQISAGMLVSAGCDYVIIGHSEQRQYFGETNATVNKKIKAAIKGNLRPIFCIGETEAERESKATLTVLKQQIDRGLKDFTNHDLKSLVIAYEPVWAIGTGKTATSEQAQDVHLYIRTQMEAAFGKEFGNSIQILYGGSVKPGNIQELINMPDIDGGLVGGASLDYNIFRQIIDNLLT